MQLTLQKLIFFLLVVMLTHATWISFFFLASQIEKDCIDFFPLRAAKSLNRSDDKHSRQLQELTKKVNALLANLSMKVSYQTILFLFFFLPITAWNRGITFSLPKCRAVCQNHKIINNNLFCNFICTKP